jgi:hypothetical protein
VSAVREGPGEVMPGDPRRGTCSRKSAKGVHVYREGFFYPDGRMRCVYCGRRKRVKK